MKRDDLRYLFDRLDRDHVAALARYARSHWDGGSVAFELAYMPGDMTHYGLSFLILGPTYAAAGAPGGGSDYTVTDINTFEGVIAAPSAWNVMRDRRAAAVTYIQQGRTGLIERGEFVDPAWVYATLIDNRASSLAIAVLLNEITGWDPGWSDRMIEDAEPAEAEGSPA